MSRLQAIVSAKECGAHSWKEIAAYAGLKRDQARTKYLNWQRYNTGDVEPGPCPLCTSGTFADVSGTYVFQEHGNYAEATLVSDEVQTLDELLEYLQKRGQDLSGWKVQDWEIKFWNMGAKIKEGHLEWDESKMTGHLDYGGLGKQDLRSIWVRFVRREPVALQPTIQPMQAMVIYPAREYRAADTAARTLVLMDAHMGFRKKVRDAKLEPFHDRRVLDLAYQVADIIRPERVLFVGDTADLADWSDKFVKEPSFYFTTQPMIIELHWWLGRFRQLLPDAEIVMHQGNHSARVPDAILTHLAAAYGLRAADELDLAPQLSLPRLLALHQLGVKWVGNYPDDEYWLTDEIRSRHGNKASVVVGATARDILSQGASTLYGHDHRKALLWDSVREKGGSRYIFAYNPGCMCHVDGRVPGHNRDQNWHQGFGVLMEHDGLVTTVDVKVTDGRAIWDGYVLEGCDDVTQLRESYPGWNW